MKTYMQLLWFQLCLFVVILIHKCHTFLSGKGGDDMYTGELIVTGEGEAIIDLRGHPKSVTVFFEGEPVIVPCDPHHHHDHLHWHIKNLHHSHKHDSRHDHCNHKDHFVLVIKWHVHNVRVIRWAVRY